MRLSHCVVLLGVSFWAFSACGESDGDVDDAQDASPELADCSEEVFHGTTCEPFSPSCQGTGVWSTWTCACEGTAEAATWSCTDSAALAACTDEVFDGVACEPGSASCAGTGIYATWTCVCEAGTESSTWSCTDSAAGTSTGGASPMPPSSVGGQISVTVGGGGGALGGGGS